MDHKLTVKHKTVKSENNIGEKLDDVGCGDDFFR